MLYRRGVERGAGVTRNTGDSPLERSRTAALASGPSGDGPHYTKEYGTPVNLRLPKSSTTETPTPGYFSRAEPALRMATTPATIVALAVAREMRGIPTSVTVAAVILSIVLPRCRRAVAATLCLLYGVAYLPVGWLRAIFIRKDHGDSMMRNLAKAVSLLNGVPVPDWVSAPAPGQAPESSPAPADAPRAAAALAPTRAAQAGHATPALPVRMTELLPTTRNAARQVGEPFFDSVMTDMAESRPRGATDALDMEIAPYAVASESRAGGRHARAESDLAETKPDLAGELASA